MHASTRLSSCSESCTISSAERWAIAWRGEERASAPMTLSGVSFNVESVTYLRSSLRRMILESLANNDKAKYGYDQL